MKPNHDKIQQVLGIHRWVLRQPPAISLAATTSTDVSHWERLQTEVKQCQACNLHQTRSQTVFGSGNTQAELMIIGEAPGYYEDQQGQPFVGRAGQLLTAMIQSIGLKREEVYIANVLKCRPPQNRDPLPQEVEQCTRFLEQQIELLQPRLILALGRIAAHYLLKTTASLESLRNRIHPYGNKGLSFIVTYHPAYLLRNPIDKKKAFQDLQSVKNLL